MASISDIIYQFEVDQIDDLEVSDLIKITRYLIENLKEDHEVPGKTWRTFAGILDWHREYKMITAKQTYWLIAHVRQYLDQRQITAEEYI